MASVPEATYRATMLALMGFDQRSALANIAVPTLVLSGSKDKNAPGADDGQDGEPIFPAHTTSSSKASAISSIWSGPAPSTPRWINFSTPHVAATRVTA